MKKILMLTLAPMRKNKGQTFSLFVFSLITAMLLNIGLVLFFGMDGFFDERAESNHAAHFTGTYFAEAAAVEQGRRFMENDPRVAEMEEIHAVGGYGDYVMNGSEAFNTILLSPVNEAQKMDAPSMVGEALPLTGDRVYIPNYIFLNGGFSLGDVFEVHLSEETLRFTVAGATEEITFGSPMGSVFRFYISDEKFNEIKAFFPGNELMILLVRLHNDADPAFFQADYGREVSSEGLISSSNYEAVKENRIAIATIIAVIIVAFALILLIVSMIVSRFRIVNGIEENMTNIGAQKAIGYRSRQIVAANVMQYGFTALAGGLAGVLLAGSVLPVISTVLEPLMALSWNPGFDMGAALISLLLVLLAVTFIAYMMARKINKLHPLVALRGGISTHSFKKNRFPLDKSPAPLGLLLALKQVAGNRKQTVTVSLIVAAVTMAATAGIAINYSLNDGRDSFARSMFGEIAMTDLCFELKNGENGDAFQDRIAEFPEVRKILGYEQNTRIKVNGTEVITSVVEDCSLLEGQMLIDGSLPMYDNEIALGTAILKITGKEIGDTVVIQGDGDKKDFIVTGIIQDANAGGFIGMLTAVGKRAVTPDFEFTMFNCYLQDGADVEAFADRIGQTEGSRINAAINIREQLAVEFDSMGSIFAAVAYGILAVTVFIIILTLHMVIKTAILRRRRELGIQKALGFMTFQLMNQIALNMTPVILFGVAAGAAAGYVGFNPIFLVMTSGMGIAKINLPVPIDQIIVVCAALIVLAYVMSLLIAWRIRKISAYALVSE